MFGQGIRLERQFTGDLLVTTTWNDFKPFRGGYWKCFSFILPAYYRELSIKKL